MRIFKSNRATLQGDDNAPPSPPSPPPPLLLHKHFPAAKYSWLRGNCEVRKMGALAVFFMSDPDPSPESGGLAVTPQQVLFIILPRFFLLQIPGQAQTCRTHHFLHLHGSAGGSLAASRSRGGWRAPALRPDGWRACPPLRAPESFMAASNRISFTPVNKTGRIPKRIRLALTAELTFIFQGLRSTVARGN